MNPLRRPFPRTIPGVPIRRWGARWWPHLLAAALVGLHGQTLGAEDADQSPIQVSASTLRDPRAIRISFDFPTNTFLYADRLAVELGGAAVETGLDLPATITIQDKFSGEKKSVFPRSFVGTCPLPRECLTSLTLTVRLQGCDEANCYFPEAHHFTIARDGTVTPVVEAAPTPTPVDAAWSRAARGFETRVQGSGYLKEAAFLDLLDRAERGGATGPPDGAPAGWGLLATLGLILLGGAGLNLTPCILPMIPLNLAIIGAGARAGSRRRGFALGGVYGLAMAMAYGALGLAVVLTGSKFGTLNASPWFNLGIALIFGVLALAMFDVWVIDLSRFQGRGGHPSGAGGRSPYLVAYSMGTVAALLAGACVAPVVISVLVQSTTLYGRGVTAGLCLPFLLGLGMGLPWPFAGAGLSFLPKPGVWMTRVKYGFGVFIVLMAGYYGVLAVQLFQSASPAATAAGPSGPGSAATVEQDRLAEALETSRVDGRPVFVDFWASWCKNCSAMEHTTFQSPRVRQRLDAYRVVRFQAERPNEPGTRAVLDHFGALGLPTYVILHPQAPARQSHTRTGHTPTTVDRRP